VNKKGISTMVIVAIVVIIIIVAGIAVYVLYMGGGGEPSASPTPTPTSNPVADATSMRFDVNATVDGELQINRVTAMNLGTSDILLRVDQTAADGTQFTYLMNETAQTVYADFGTGYTDQSSDFTTYWDNTLIGNAGLQNYMTALANWSGVEGENYSYEDGGNSFVIYNIVVNPQIDDPAAVFQPPM
jgi:hypothetical protein